MIVLMMTSMLTMVLDYGTYLNYVYPFNPFTMRELNCVTIVRIQHLECMPITHQKPPSPECVFDNIDTKLTIYRAIPEAAGVN